MSTNQNKNEEEVDLGSLFIIIGKGFNRLFNFIGSIFKGIFHAFIVVLLFIKTNIIALFIAGLVGGIIGFFLDFNTPKMYASEMLVKPNFGSSKLLYKNIDFYNDLIKQKDTISLEKTFGITKDIAGSIKKITIEPIISEYDIVNSYDDFVKEVDTTTIKNYEYEDFKASFTDLDYQIHRIKVKAEKKDIFSKLENTIISSVEKNTYFSRLKNYTFANLNTTDTLIKKSITQIDSLQNALVKSTMFAAKKVTSGTNIDLGTSNSRPKEVELLEANRRLIKDLQEVVKDRSEKNVVINIVSNFKSVGNEIKGVTENKAVQYGFLGASLMILCLILIKINAFLNNYKK